MKEQDLKNEEFSISSLSHISIDNKMQIASQQSDRNRNQHRKLGVGSCTERQKTAETQQPKDSALFKYMSNKFKKEFTEVGELIKESIRRNRLQEEMNKLMKIEAKEKQKQAKEILQERNRKIREMNAGRTNAKQRSQAELKIPWGAGKKKVTSKSGEQKMVSQQNKENIKNQKDARISQLGLEILYLQNKKIQEHGNSKVEELKVNKESQRRSTSAEQRDNIRKYIKEKKTKTETQKNIKIKEEIKKRKNLHKHTNS